MDLLMAWLPFLVAAGALAMWTLRWMLGRPMPRRHPPEPRLETTASIEEALAEALHLLPSEVLVVRKQGRVWAYVSSEALRDRRRVLEVEGQIQRRLPGEALRVMALMQHGHDAAG